MFLLFRSCREPQILLPQNFKHRTISSIALTLVALQSTNLSISTPSALAKEAAAATWQAYLEQGDSALTEQNISEAEAAYRKALELVEKNSHKPVDEENCVRKLADTLMLRNKVSEAQNLYLRLLNTLVSRYGNSSPKLGKVLISLGSIQEALGNHQLAMDYYQRALKINEKNYGYYSPEFADNLQSVGRTSFRLGQTEDGHKYFKQSIKILTNQPSLSASEQLKRTLKDYKDILKGEDKSNQTLIEDFNKDIYGDKKGPKGDAQSSPQPKANQSSFETERAFKLKASAQEQISEAPQIVLKGLNHPETEASLAPVFKTMNETIYNQSHFERGEDYYQRKISIDIEALGATHPAVANDMCSLAVYYMSRAQFAKAKPLLSKALPIYESTYGQDNILTINTRASLASTLFHLGETAQAATVYRQALSRGQKTLTPNSIETARILNDLAYLYFQQGKLEDSCTFYEWALASTEGAVGQKDPLLAACLKDYAQVLRGLGRGQEASAAEARAERIIDAKQ